MSSFALNSSPLRALLLSYLPASVKTLLLGESGGDLVKKITATLLIYEDKLIHLESQKSLCIPNSDASKIEGAPLAKVCRDLLGEVEKESSLLLLLPAKEFVATTLHMPGIGKDSLAPALRIQSDAILPSFEQSLSLAVNPASADRGEDHVALWITENRLNELFDAFKAVGLFLAAVQPRLLNVAGEAAAVIDNDSSTHTLATLQQGVLQQWLHVQKQDFEQEQFKQQWQSVLAQEAATAIELNGEQDYFDHSDKNTRREYCFFPRGALIARQRLAKGKRLTVAAAAVAILLLIAAVPFIMQSLQHRSLVANLESRQQMASDARQDQAAVIDFENEWGSINDYPEQRIREAMFTLQGILSPDALTSMEVSEGVIKIQGTSAEPQAILQRLEQDPMFTEVLFSRATNNNRYYIDLRLSTVNFEGYMVRYFPDE